MNRKIFLVELDGISPHNTLFLKPVSADVRVIQIKTIGSDSEEVIILDNPITVEGPSSIRYPAVVSGRVWIEIEGSYVNELALDDLLGAQISMAKYGNIGEIISEDNRLNFHEYLSVAFEVSNVKDAFIQGDLGVRTLDKYDNIVYTESIPISLNDDQVMIAHATSGSYIDLPIKPQESSVKVLVANSYTEEFTLDGSKVIIDIPNDVSCYVLYKPFYVEDGMFSKITDNVSISPNGEIKLRDENCSSIIYNFKLNVYNTDLTSTNHTPIIKSLALISSNQ
jgi:hypothetical protein